MGVQANLAPNGCSKIIELVNAEAFQADVAKAYAGNKAAITRVRVQLALLANSAKATREELLNLKKNLPLTKPE